MNRVTEENSWVDTTGEAWHSMCTNLKQKVDADVLNFVAK